MREMCGEHIITADTLENIDFNRIITLNESAAYLWEKVSDIRFDAETLAGLLAAKYDISPGKALEDSTELCRKWKEAGLTE